MEFQYAGFSKRFVAGIVDGLVSLPLVGLYYWLSPQSKIAALIVLPIMIAFYPVYSICFHARYGQTLGKMAAGIRVLRVNGQPIGLREALMRSSVEAVLGILTCVGSLMALSAMPDSAFSNLSWLDFNYMLQLKTPAWSEWTQTANVIWTWGEVIVVLFNRKRRALHDFIAGTIVVVDQKPAMEHLGTPAP